MLHNNKSSKVSLGSFNFFDTDSKNKVLKNKAPPFKNILVKKITNVDIG
jgi:hypothetical protein